MPDDDVARLVADMLSWRRAREPDACDARLALAVAHRIAGGARVAWEDLVALARDAGAPSEAGADAGVASGAGAHCDIGAHSDAGDGPQARAERVAALAERTDDGSIVGIHGLSVEPTAYTLTLPGGRRGTWCALDTVFLPPLLGQEATVAGHCAVTKAPVSLSVAADGRLHAAEPATLVLTVPVPDPAAPPRTHDELRATFCARSRFAVDAATATGLVGGTATVEVLDLDAAQRVGRGIAEGLRARAGA